MKGTIKKVTDKGFGFIASDDSDKDIFFHATALADGVDFNSIREGDNVEFDIEETDKGQNAVNVTVVA